jgi:hypothetical protein
MMWFRVVSQEEVTPALRATKDFPAPKDVHESSQLKLTGGLTSTGAGSSFGRVGEFAGFDRSLLFYRSQTLEGPEPTGFAGLPSKSETNFASPSPFVDGNQPTSETNSGSPSPSPDRDKPPSENASPCQSHSSDREQPMSETASRSRSSSPDLSPSISSGDEETSLLIRPQSSPYLRNQEFRTFPRPAGKGPLTLPPSRTQRFPNCLFGLNPGPHQQ